jgi:hypothetical protein
MPTGAGLKDLGTHRLKDLSAPERVWQLTHPKLDPDGEGQGSAGATVTPIRRAYVLTDHLNSADGREWGERKTYTVSTLASGDRVATIRCYVSPSAAALLNAINERFRMPKLWEAVVDREPAPDSAVIECREVTTLRQVPLPTVTGKHYAHFAVLCAGAAYEGEEHCAEFNDWAAGWLTGQDSSGVDARGLADTLADQAHRGAGMALPEIVMLAHAARAAAHASRLSWLVGRARDEENARAIECAVEAVHIAMRITRLDLVSLAEQAVPKTLAPVTPLRYASAAAGDRILRALPT